jgi:hypothetical protein
MVTETLEIQNILQFSVWASKLHRGNFFKPMVPRAAFLYLGSTLRLGAGR